MWEFIISIPIAIGVAILITLAAKWLIERS